jgi:hypothetical protein
MDGYSQLKGFTGMARTTSIQSTINSLTEAFARELTGLVEQAAAARIQAAILGGLGGGGRRPGRPPKGGMAALPALPAFSAPRKKAPKQLCPVPGCKNPAAPVFGMVCAKHKDIAKAKIKKYREDRRAAKQAKKAA